MNAARWILRAVTGVALTLAVVGLSQVRWSPVSGDAGELRLAWSYRSAPVEQCRRLTPAELAQLPVHMRREVSCERRLMPYRLRVQVDGATVADDTIVPRGARADRPLSLYHALPLAPGRRTISLRFAALEPETTSAGARAPALTLDTTITVGPRRVVLATLDDARGVLVLR